MKNSNAEFILLNAGFYLSVYLLQEINNKTINYINQLNLYEIFPGLYETYNGICPLGDVLLKFLGDNICDSVILEIKEKKINNIYKKGKLDLDFFQNGINNLWKKGLGIKNIKILLKGIDEKKLIDYIKLYIEKWENDDILFTDNYLYKKDKQIKVVNLFIDKLLEDYSYLDLKVILRDFRDNKVDILAVLLYLQNNNRIKLKKIIINGNISNLIIVLDIIGDNNKLTEKAKVNYNYNNGNVYGGGIQIINNLIYFKEDGLFKRDGDKYEIPEHYKYFINLLLDKYPKRVPYEEITSLLKENIEYSIIDIMTYKGNLIKLLKKNKIILPNESFINGKNKGYKIELLL